MINLLTPLDYPTNFRQIIGLSDYCPHERHNLIKNSKIFNTKFNDRNSAYTGTKALAGNECLSLDSNF